MFKHWLLLVFVFLSSLGATDKKYPMHSPSHPIPLIIDTDANMNAFIGMSYLLKNIKVNIKAITVVGDGMSHMEYGTKNILNFLQLVGDPKMQVAYGEKASMSPYVTYPTLWREKTDNLYGIELPNNPYHPSSLIAEELITEILTDSYQKVAILCLGPLTNIAAVLQKKPELKEKIKMLYALGGAVYVPGNLIGEVKGIKNRYAEYNIAIDAKAASIVLEAGVPITLIPLDVTKQVPITNKIVNDLKKAKEKSLASFVDEIIEKAEQPRLGAALAGALITDSNIGHYEILSLKVVQVEGPEYGRVELDKEGLPVKICLYANTSRFYRIFLETLTSK